jgi:SAM-dependent methyltransferase
MSDAFSGKSKFTNGVQTEGISDDLRQLVQTQFGGSAQCFVESRMHKEGDDLARMVELSGVLGTDRVLDIATGGGHTALSFSKRAQGVIALDLTTEMLTAARRFLSEQGQTNVQFVRGDAESLPFPSDCFDLVTARLAPHHFPKPGHFVKEAARVLRPGGRFVLDDNMGPDDDELDDFMDRFERWRDPSHVRALRLPVWKALCEEHGFEVLHADPLVKKTYPYQEWTARMRLPKDQTEALAAWILGASRRCKEYFRVHEENGQLQSLCATFGILCAGKKGPRIPHEKGATC